MKRWGLLAVAILGVAIAAYVGYQHLYVQPRLEALRAEERALDAEIARYKARLPELARLEAQRARLRQDLLFLEEEDRRRRGLGL